MDATATIVSLFILESQRMSGEKDRIFEAFSKLVGHIEATWAFWKGMFHPEPGVESHQEVFRDSGSEFWGYTRYWLMAATILDLAALGDRRCQSGRENLTLERVYDELGAAGSERDRKMVREALDDALAVIQSESLRQLRNRIIAHNDLRVAIGDEKDRPDIPIIDIDNAVSVLMDFWVRVEAVRAERSPNIGTGEDYGRPHNATEPMRNEAQKLIGILRRGLGQSDQAG